MKKILLHTVGCSVLMCALSSPKIRFLMRASIVLWLSMAISLQLAAFNSIGQGIDSEITLELKHTSLKEALRILQNKTNIPMVYAPDLVTNYNDINLSNEKRTVRTILEIILKETDISYLERENAIVLRRQTKAEVSDFENSTFLTQITFLTVSGKVTDATTGEALIGVSIVVKGTTRGTSSDADGIYTIDAQENEILVFTYIGYKPQELIVGTRSQISIALISDTKLLDEVPVVGTTYFTTTKPSSTASIVKITAKQLENQPVTTPLLSLQGRVPGLEINPGTGAAGAAAKIKIRGTNSITTNGSYPLYIIDGVPIESRPISSPNDDFTYGGDPLSTLNMNNIESIEILKDADATGIYGTRGANGVIVIKTKRNKIEQGTNIELNAYRGVGRSNQKINLLDASQYLSMRREAFQNANTVPDENTGYDLVLWDTTRNTNWQKKLLGGTAHITDMQGNIGTGNANNSYRFGIGYHKETTIFPGDFSFQKLNGALSTNHISSNNKFEVSVSLNYGHEKNKSFKGTSTYMGNALYLPPVAPALYDENGELNFAPNSFGTSTFDNPLATLQNTTLSSNSNLNANSIITYELLKGLKAKIVAGYSNLNGKSFSQSPVAARRPDVRPYYKGSSTFTFVGRQTWIIEPQLTYYKTFRKHQLNALLGGTLQSGASDNTQIQAFDYASDALLTSLDGGGRYTTVDGSTEYRYISSYARIGYTYDSKYVLNATVRRDGSSRFGPGRQFGNFGSIAGAWIFSNEEFIKNNLQFISFAKLRSSLGITGNDNAGDYKFYDLYRISEAYQNGVTLTPRSLYNPNYKWESTRKLDVAIEISFLNEKIAIELNWYKNTTKDQLLEYTLPQTTGFQSVNANFPAIVENTGWEGMINLSILQTNSLKWTISANLTIPSNKLAKFDGIEDSPYAQLYKVGKPLSILRQYRYSGVDQVTGRYTFVDIDGNGVVDYNDQAFTYGIDQKYYGGITTNLQVGNFSLSALFHFSKQPVQNTFAGAPGMDARNQPDYVAQHWRREGDQSDVAQFTTDFFPYIFDFFNLANSDQSYTTSTFWRLQTLTLSYKLPEAVCQRLHLTASTIFLQGQNLLTLSRYRGFDPQIAATASPSLSIASLGANVKF